MMIGGGFVKDGLYYFQPSSTLVPSALHSTNSLYQWHCRLGHLLSANLKHLVPSLATFSSFNCETCELNFEMMTHVYIRLSWFTLIFGG